MEAGDLTFKLLAGCRIKDHIKELLGKFVKALSLKNISRRKIYPVILLIPDPVVT